MFAKRIMIRDLESQYNAEYIANVFWSKCIARVSSITLIPYIIDDKITNTAYVEIDSFCETEEGRNCAKALTLCDGMMFGHAVPEEENIWVFEPNTHYQGELCVGSFTTKFAADFFEPKEAKSQQVDEDEESYCMDEEEAEEFERRYPIRGLDGVYYDFEGALEHLWVLNEECDDTEDSEKRTRIEKELMHFETQIQKYYIEQNSNLKLVESCLKISREMAAVDTHAAW
jgi:hypothetical protein